MMREHYDDRMEAYIESDYDEAIDRHALEAESDDRRHRRGKWYVLPAMGGAGKIVEAGAGVAGGPGHVGTCELIADAEWIAAMHNARRTA